MADSRIGLSVSESADLNRLGLVERHLRLALGEVARAVIRGDLSPVYGGHLRADGYTVFLESEMERYGSVDRPLELVLGWSEHRAMSLTELHAHQEQLGLRARITYLDAEGNSTKFDSGRGEDPEEVEDVSGSLTALRRYLVQHTDARVLIGGKEKDFKGKMPGVLEEALLAINAGQPLYLVGGFGGATATIASAVAGLDGRWPPAERSAEVDQVLEAAGQSGWSISGNGLTDDENRQLAVCHRPGEVASLVAVGLGRIFHG